MTIPNFDYLRKQVPNAPVVPSTTPTQGQIPDFSYLAPAPKEQEEGAWSRLGRTFTNLNKLYQLSSANPLVGGAVANPDILAEYGMAASQIQPNATEFSAARAAIDLRDMFSKVSQNPGESISNLWKGVKETSKHPWDLIPAVAEGFMRMPLSVAESATGVSFAGERLEAMTPEQRASSIKEATGNIVGLAAGGVANKAMEAAFVKVGEVGLASAVAAEHTTEALNQFQKGVVKGALARKIVTGTVEGGAFGAAQSSVMYANTDEQLTQMLMNGIVMAPLGSALELIHGKKLDNAGKRLYYEANDILRTRQLQFSLDQSIADIGVKTEILKTADDIVDAIIKQQVTLNDNGVVHITGIKEPSELFKYRNKIFEYWRDRPSELMQQKYGKHLDEVKSVFTRARDAFDKNNPGARNDPLEYVPAPKSNPSSVAKMQFDTPFERAYMEAHVTGRDIAEGDYLMHENIVKAFLDDVLRDTPMTENERFDLEFRLGELQQVHLGDIRSSALIGKESVDGGDVYPDTPIKAMHGLSDVKLNRTAESIMAADRITYERMIQDQVKHEREISSDINVAVYADKKGNTSAIFYGKDAPSYIKESVDFYKKHGFIKGEIVSLNGDDVIVKGYNSSKFQMDVENPQTGRLQSVDVENLRRKFNGPREPQRVAIKSAYNLKGRFTKEVREMLKAGKRTETGWGASFDKLAPLEQQAVKAWASTKTGQAISAAAFRFQRGHAIGKTGRFYGPTANSIQGYRPDVPGRVLDTVGPINPLVIHKLEFKNPAVIEAGRKGAHNTIWENLNDPTSELRQHIPNPNPELMQSLRAARDITYGSKKGKRGLHPESGWQVQDVIIAKMLKEAGFDGIVYKKGEPGNHFANSEIVDLRGTSIMDNRTEIEGYKLGSADAEVFQQKMFDDWKKMVVEADLKYDTVNLGVDSHSLYGELAKTPKTDPNYAALSARYSEMQSQLIRIWDKGDKLKLNFTPDDYANKIPQMSFTEATNAFFHDRGFLPEEIAFMQRDFEKRIHNELIKGMDPDEVKVIERMRDEAEAHHSELSQQKFDTRQKTVKDLLENASNNGYYIDKEDADNIILRDHESDKIVGKFKTLAEANTFINESGQAVGIDLDGGNGNALPPSITGTGGLSGVPDHPERIPDFNPLQGRMATIISNLNSTFEWATPNRGVIAALDQRFNAYKTDFFNRIFDKGQRAVARRNAEIHPWYDKLKGIEEELGNMSLGDRETIANYMETMSPDELRQRGGAGGKPLNKAELDLGNWLSSKNTDISKVFKYRRALTELAEAYKGSIGTPEHMQAIQQVNDNFNMTPDENNATNLIDGYLRMNKGGLGPAVRYARGVMNADVNRVDFAAKHKMTSKQLAAAAKLDKLYADLGQRFGIDPKHQISNYMTHARLYDNGKISDTLKYYDSQKIGTGPEDFYASLTRTGEIDAFETDPIKAVQRYIKAGMDAEILHPALKEMDAALPQELLKLPDNERQKTQTIVQRYITDLQGMPNAADRFAQQATDNIMSKLGIESSVDLRRGIVNFISASMEAGAQGFRLIAGMRDFSTGMIAYYARFGAKRTANMLRYGVAGYKDITRAKLAGENIIPTLTPIYFDTPTDMSGRAIGRASNMMGQMWRGVTDKALAVSGQRAVYGMFHAGAYIDTWKLSGEQINKFREGKIKWAEVQKNLGLQMYDDAVQKGFQDKITAGQYEEAANFLARQTGSEVIGVYGMANHPSGWNRNVGRVAGQFGSWSMFHRTFLTRLASQGTYGQRFGAMARLGAANIALYGVGKAMGVDLSNWTSPAGVFFGGGPMLGMYDSMNDYMNSHGYEQSRASSKLARTLSLFVPGMQTGRDLNAADTLSEEGADESDIIKRGLGFRLLPPEE